MESLALFGQASWQFINALWYKNLEVQVYIPQTQRIDELTEVTVEREVPTEEELEQIVTRGNSNTSEAFRNWRMQLRLTANIERPGGRELVQRMIQSDNLTIQVQRPPTDSELLRISLRQNYSELRRRIPYSQRTPEMNGVTDYHPVRPQIEARYGPQRIQLFRDMDSSANSALRRLKIMIDNSPSRDAVIRRVMGRGIISTIDPRAMANPTFRARVKEVTRSVNVDALQSQLDSMNRRELEWRNKPNKTAADYKLDPASDPEFYEMQRILDARIKTLRDPNRNNWTRAIRRIVGAVRPGLPDAAPVRIRAPALRSTPYRPPRSSGRVAATEGGLVEEFAIFMFALAETFKDERKFSQLNGSEGELFGDPNIMRAQLTSPDFYKAQLDSFLQPTQDFVNTVDRNISNASGLPNQVANRQEEKVNALSGIIDTISSVFKNSQEGDLEQGVSTLISVAFHRNNPHREYHSHPVIDLSMTGLTM